MGHEGNVVSLSCAQKVLVKRTEYFCGTGSDIRYSVKVVYKPYINTSLPRFLYNLSIYSTRVCTC